VDQFRSAALEDDACNEVSNSDSEQPEYSAIAQNGTELQSSLSEVGYMNSFRRIDD